MKRFLQMLSCALLAGAWVCVCCAGDTASVALDGRTLSSDRLYWTYSNITLVHADNKPFKSLMISLTRELVDSDEIVLPSDTSKIKVKSDLSSKTSKIVQINGASDAEIAAYLSGVKFYTVKNPKGQGVKVVATPEDITAKTFYLESTRHYYQYIRYASPSDPYVRRWHECYDDAKSMSFLGRQGYMATVTSKEEDLFLYRMSGSTEIQGGVGWLAGTILPPGQKLEKVSGASVKISGQENLFYKDFDRSGFTNDQTYKHSSDGKCPEGVNRSGWYWACGPERGEVFFDDLLVGNGISKAAGSSSFPSHTEGYRKNSSKGYYFNWKIRALDPEPNFGGNCDMEQSLTTLLDSSFVGYATGEQYHYGWNNLKDFPGNGSGVYSPKGYFVEYGNLKVGDSTETNPPKEWGVSEESVPSIYYVSYRKTDGDEAVNDFLASDVASNLWAAASIAALTPPDNLHTNFYGWSKTQGATVPDLIDQQPIQGYAPALETVNLYPVWTDRPVVTGRFVTRKKAEIFQMKAVDFDRKSAGTLTMTDGGGTETNLVCYAFAAPRGVYGFDITQKVIGYGAWVDLVVVETDGVMTGPDFTKARIWDRKGNTTYLDDDRLDASQLVGRISQTRGTKLQRNCLFGAMPVFESVAATEWVIDKVAAAASQPTDSSWSRYLYAHPEVYAESAVADGSISALMKRRWSELRQARSSSFMALKVGLDTAFEAKKGSAMYSVQGLELSLSDVSPAWAEGDDRFVVAAIQDEDCRADVTNLPWRIYRYYKGEDGVEHYDIIKQRHEGSEYTLADGSAGPDLGEYIELHDGYALLYLKRFGQLAFIDPTDVEITPGEQYKQDESTWGWTNMTAYGEMKYDRMELTLKNSTNVDDKIIFPAGTGWAPAVQPNQHQFYTNLTESTNVSIQDIATNVLSKVRLELPSNGDDIYWSIRLYRADGYKPYEFDIGISNAWYVVAYRPTIPGAGNTVYLTYKNVRTIKTPLASENLGFGIDGKVFYCWQRNGQSFLDDGQPFFDISKAFQTNYLNAVWVDTPVISGDCPTNVNALTSAKLVSLGATSEAVGNVLFAGAAPGRYVATAVPGVYDLVYTDKDGLPHTELIELTEGRRIGPSFADDRISTGVDNANAEPGFKLLAGGLRAYDSSVYAVCKRYFEIVGSDYDHFSTPTFNLVSAKVSDSERDALQGEGAASCFAVRARMSVTLLSTPDPSYRGPWNPAEQSDPSKLGETIGQTDYYLKTNILVELIVPFDTRPFAGCTNTWAISRMGDGGNLETLAMTPNAKGEFFALADDYIRLTVKTFGAFGIKTPDLTTKIDLGAAGYTNEYGVSYFPAAQGSGDRLYSSVRVDLKNFDQSSAVLGMVEMGLLDPAAYGAEVLANSSTTNVCVRFAVPKTAAEIAAFIAHCLWVDSDYSFIGADVTVSCFENDATEGEPQYTSETGHIKTRAAALVFRPGTRGTVNGEDVSFIAPSNTVQYLIPENLFFALGFWKTNEAETVNTHFYGWEFNGEVCFGAEQQVLNKLRIGATNVLTAVWTNMPVVAGDVALDADAATVSVQSFTNLVAAAIFKGGADMNRYALPLPGGRPYNVSVEYRDTVGGEVKSVETVLVTNDVVSGATYDSTGRVATATSVVRPTGDLDFVLVGGLESITGSFAAVVAQAGHLASGAGYVALTNAVGTKAGTYFNLAIETNETAVGMAPAPLTLLLPFDSTGILDSPDLFKVYRYQAGAVAEVPTNEYAVCDGYLELITTNVAPIAIAKSLPVVFADCGKDTLRWMRTTARSSYFAAIRLKLVSGDIDSIADACFLFEDRLTNRVDGGGVATNACLWGGRLDRQDASNHVAADTVRVNGVVFRKVPLEFFKEAVGNADAEGLVAYGVTDESYAATKLLPEIASIPVSPDVTNAWAHQTEIEVVMWPGEKIETSKESLDGVMGFLGYSTGGQRMTYIALASGDQGGITNYQAIVTEITEAALASANPQRMLRLVSEGPVGMSPANLSRIRQSLAVTAIVDENSDPYCRIADVSFDETAIAGRIEVGAGDQQGAVGRNASVTLLGAASVDGAYTALQTIQSVGADGSFRFSRPAGYSFFKLRINVQDL